MTTSTAETAKRSRTAPPSFPNHSIGLAIPKTWMEKKTGKSTNGTNRNGSESK